VYQKQEKSKKSQPLGMTKERVTSLWNAVSDEKRLGPATTLDETVALSFVIPSEAEGPAVLRTFSWKCSGEICGFLLGLMQTP
jgi:hypothetical protein